MFDTSSHNPSYAGRMSVAAHLGIDIDDYDRRIRTFIPRYEEMLDAAAEAVGRRAGVILDLGIGTGALAARCLAHSPRARIVGVDVDPEMLALAARRLPPSTTLTRCNFLRAPLPPADVAIASFALHHVRTRPAKERFYRRLRKALASDGIFVSADSHPDADRDAASAQREAWLAHLRKSYAPAEAVKILDSWSDEDVYQPLDVELNLLRRAGFRVDVPWRREGFAVIRGRRDT
jgi:SAM-dependent methyltransferase